MRRIRIHNDITVKWKVTTNGEPLSLEGRALRLLIYNAYSKKYIDNFSVDGNVVSFVFAGLDQKSSGVYTAVLQDTTSGMRTVDKVQAFELVRHTIEQNGTDDSNITTEVVELASDFDAGIVGRSAYEIAVKNGYTGTEEEWLASLKGEAGASAYQTWINHGNKGTEEDFIASLKGNALTYDDLTEQQINELKKPAEDAAVKVGSALAALSNKETDIDAKERERQAAELSRATAENERESTEADRTQAEDRRKEAETIREKAFAESKEKADTAATNANTAADNANAAATSTNEALVSVETALENKVKYEQLLGNVWIGSAGDFSALAETSDGTMYLIDDTTTDITTTAGTGVVQKMWFGTRNDYDRMTTKDDSTLYMLVEEF